MAYVGTYVLIAAVVFLLLYLTGRAVDRRRLAATGNRLDTVTLRAVLGIAVWVGLLFVLAASQLFTPAGIRWLAAALVLLAGVDLARRRPALPQLARPRLDVAAVGTSILLATLVAVAVSLWLQVLRPLVAWDADVYHLTLPRLYLEHGGFYRVPFNVYSDWPSNVQLLFALALALRDHVLAKALHFGFGLATALLVGGLVARETSPRWGVVAGGLLFLHPVFLWEIRVAYVDLAAAFLLLAALAFVHRALEKPERERGWLAAAALAAGLLAGVKINGIFGLAAVAVVWLGSQLLRRRAMRTLAVPLAVLVAPALLVALPWLVRSLVQTGNPVYPLLWSRFGGPEWSESLARAHAAWTRSMGMGRTPTDYLLLLPRVLLAGGEGYARFDGRLHPAWAVLLPLAVVGGSHSPLARRALAAAGIWFVAWAASSQQMRLLLPALPLTAVAVGIAGYRLLPRRQSLRRFAELAAAVALAAGLVLAALPYLGQAPRLVEIFRHEGDAVFEHATDDVYRFVDAELPANAKLLFVNVNRGFFCHRPYLADSFFEASQTAAWLGEMGDLEGVRRGLRAAGVSHVLVQDLAGGPAYPRPFVEYLGLPVHRRVYESPPGDRNRYYVVELESGAASAPAAR